jgi:hypothetical protein
LGKDSSASESIFISQAFLKTLRICWDFAAIAFRISNEFAMGEGILSQGQDQRFGPDDPLDAFSRAAIKRAVNSSGIWAHMNSISGGTRPPAASFRIEEPSPIQEFS